MNLPVGPMAGVSIALLFAAIRQSCKKEREARDLSARAYLERARVMENMQRINNINTMRQNTNAQLKSYTQEKGIVGDPYMYDQSTMAGMITRSGR